MRSLRHTLIAAAVIAAAVSCTDHPTATPPPPPPPPSPPPPPPGSGIVALVTPNSDDGALRLTLRGPGLTTLAAASASHVFYQRLVSDSEARMILVGDVEAGQLITFKIASGQSASAYSATLEQVASRRDSIRLSLSGYSLTVSRAP
jgi:hypothetical protein